MRVLSDHTQQNISEFRQYFLRRYPRELTPSEAKGALTDLYANANVEFAYFEPRWSDAVDLSRMRKTSAVQAPVQDQNSPGNYEFDQFYLNPAPIGIDARIAWALPGGAGRDVRVIDVETGWHTDHFEFGYIFYDNGKNVPNDHGTAVWGTIAARPEGKGITGIAFDVSWGIAANGNWRQWL